MMSPDEIEEKIRLVKPVLQNEFCVSKIGYFGSYARGDFREDSDLDVIVEVRDGIGWKFFDIRDYLESLLNLKVDVVTERSLRKEWRSDILREVKYI